MLTLNDSLLVAQGHRRKCYVHPDDRSKCVKIVWRGDDRETKREQAYYHRLEKRGNTWSILPRYYGEVPTNLGRGTVFQLIRDHTGDVSKTLEHYFSLSDSEVIDRENLSREISHFKRTLLNDKILFTNLTPANIVYQRDRDSTGRLVLIDNLGHNDAIPVCDYLGFLAILKIQRRWKRFEKNIVKNEGYSKTMRELMLQARG